MTGTLLFLIVYEMLYFQYANIDPGQSGLRGGPIFHIRLIGHLHFHISLSMNLNIHLALLTRNSSIHLRDFTLLRFWLVTSTLFNHRM